MPSVELPAIDIYLLAHDRRNTEQSIDCFDPGAIVIRRGRGLRRNGTHAVVARQRGAEFTWTRTLVQLEQPDDDVYVVHSHVCGNFPGGEADLRHRFELRAGFIHGLEIAP